MTLNLEDNVGIAVFGDISTVIAEPTCDYNKLLLQIGILNIALKDLFNVY